MGLSSSYQREGFWSRRVCSSMQCISILRGGRGYEFYCSRGGVGNNSRQPCRKLSWPCVSGLPSAPSRWCPDPRALPARCPLSCSRRLRNRPRYAWKNETVREVNECRVETISHGKDPYNAWMFARNKACPCGSFVSSYSELVENCSTLVSSAVLHVTISCSFQDAGLNTGNSAWSSLHLQLLVDLLFLEIPQIVYHSSSHWWIKLSWNDI